MNVELVKKARKILIDNIDNNFFVKQNKPYTLRKCVVISIFVLNVSKILQQIHEHVECNRKK